MPVGKDPLSFIIGKKFGEEVPHILYDGIRNPQMLDAQGKWIPGQCISIVNNKGQSIANLDAEHGFKNMENADNSFNCNN